MAKLSMPTQLTHPPEVEARALLFQGMAVAVNEIRAAYGQDSAVYRAALDLQTRLAVAAYMPTSAVMEAARPFARD